MNYMYEVEGHTHVLRDDGPDGFRLLSHPTQAPLIGRLRAAPEARVEVVSLNLVTPKDDSNEPGDILEALRTSPGGAPDKGGWREIDAYEHAALELSRRAIEPNLFDSLFMGSVLENHPAVRQGITFATGGQLNRYTLGLMAEIFDILRFNSRKHDTWGTKHIDPPRALLTFLKLTTPLEIARAINGEAPKSREGLRAHVALRAWTCTACTAEEEASKDCDNCPKGFLTRAQKSGGFMSLIDITNRYDATVMGLWFATRLFVEFFRRLWTAGVCDREFKPEDFFRQESEVEGFKDYIKELDEKLDNS